MKTKDSINFFILLVFLLFNSCGNNENDELSSAFSKADLKNIDRIIEFYDNHVIVNTDKTLPIDKAYKAFIEQNRPNDSMSNNENIFYINSEKRNHLLGTINPELLKEIYKLRDSVQSFDLRTKERFVVYPPFSTNINRDGKFMRMLEKMSEDNPFYKKTYEEIINCGDICPSTLARLLYYNDSVDFNRKAERFVFAVSFLDFEIDYDIYRNNAP